MSDISLASTGSTSETEHSTSMCPDKVTIDHLLKLGNIYFGETHGNHESPHLVECIVSAAVKKHIKPLYVSFELPPRAHDLSDAVWSGTDGRTSKAYADLLSNLLAHQSRGDIEIDYQLVGTGGDDEAVNQQIGEHLKMLLSKGTVIAIGGSMHAQRRQAIAPFLKFTPAGAYTGPSLVSILLDTTGKGTTWDCTDGCAVHSTDRFTDESLPWILKDGKAYGFDYVLMLPPLSASPPALKSFSK